jgi:hypothetical protein
MKENKLTKIHCSYYIVCSELYMASHVGTYQLYVIFYLY